MLRRMQSSPVTGAVASSLLGVAATTAPRASMRFSPGGSRIDPHLFNMRPPRNKVFHIVPQGTAMVVERLGKYHRTLEPGLAILAPLIDRIRYVYSTKEQGILIPRQSAITRDNVMVDIDGVLFLRIVDSRKASYNIDNPIFNVINLAQTTMRCEIGRLSLDGLFSERSDLNRNIMNVIQTEAQEWGVECKRYEIRDISVSDIVRQSMDLQAEAERRKRKLVLESQGESEAMINRAQGERNAKEQAALALKFNTETTAEATAKAMQIVAVATAESLSIVARGLDSHPRTQEAMALRVAEQYLEHFGAIARESSTVVLPANVSDGASLTGTALALLPTLQKNLSGSASSKPPSS